MCEAQKTLRSSCGSAGFTILELIVVIMMLSILAHGAVSGTMATLKSADKNSARVQVVQDLRRAQATSVTEGCRGIFEVINSGSQYTYGCDYLPYDTDPIPSADSITFTGTLPNGITMTTDSLIIFNSRGQVVNTNYSLVTRTVTLTTVGQDFATGTLRATGFFSYS